MSIINIVSVKSQIGYSYTIEGNTVYIDIPNKGRISQTPHTLTDLTNKPVVNFTSYFPTEQCFDFAFGFDKSGAVPTRNIQLYKPTYYNMTHRYTCNEDYFNYTLNPNHAWCWRNVTDYGSDVAPNQTAITVPIGWHYELIFDHSFDSGSIAEQTIYWDETAYREWVDIGDTFNQIVYQGTTYYYITGVVFQPNETKTIKPELKIAPMIGKNSGKYNILIKRCEDSIATALSSGNYVMVDPWWNTSWDKKRLMNISEIDTAATLGRTFEPVTQNISFITSITNCRNEMRVTMCSPENSTACTTETEIPSQVIHGDNSTWCEIVFLANVSADSWRYFYAYYNNSDASEPDYSSETGLHANATDFGDTNLDVNYNITFNRFHLTATEYHNMEFGDALAGQSWKQTVDGSVQVSYQTTYDTGTVNVTMYAFNRRIDMHNGTASASDYVFTMQGSVVSNPGGTSLKVAPQVYTSDGTNRTALVWVTGENYSAYVHYNAGERAWAVLIDHTDFGGGPGDIYVGPDTSGTCYLYADTLNDTQDYYLLMSGSDETDRAFATNEWSKIVNPLIVTLGAEESPPATPPTYALNSTNSTRASMFIEHRLNWTDNVALSGYIFSFDNCTGALVNDTWVSFGSNTWSNVTKMVNSSVCTVQWCVYANDTSDGWNGTSCATPFSYITTYSNPTYSSNSTNGTVANTFVEHSLQWADDIALSGYIFSFDNCTGTMVNDSWVSMVGTGNWSNITKPINSTTCNIQWCVYANNTFGGWNGSSCANPFTYTTTGVPSPEVATDIININIIVDTVPSQMFCHNSTHLYVVETSSFTYDGNTSDVKQEYYKWCEYGCDTTTNTCSPISSFNLNFIIIGSFVGAWIVFGIFHHLTRKMPVVKYFIWFFVIIGMLVLLFYTPLPSYFTTQQIDMTQIFIIISILFAIALLLIGDRYG